MTTSDANYGAYPADYVAPVEKGEATITAALGATSYTASTWRKPC
jgi:hypothetical protein